MNSDTTIAVSGKDLKRVFTDLENIIDNKTLYKMYNVDIKGNHMIISVNTSISYSADIAIISSNNIKDYNLSIVLSNISAFMDTAHEVILSVTDNTLRLSQGYFVANLKVVKYSEITKLDDTGNKELFQDDINSILKTIKITKPIAKNLLMSSSAILKNNKLQIQYPTFILEQYIKTDIDIYISEQVCKVLSEFVVESFVRRRDYTIFFRGNAKIFIPKKEISLINIQDTVNKLKYLGEYYIDISIFKDIKDMNVNICLEKNSSILISIQNEEFNYLWQVGKKDDIVGQFTIMLSTLKSALLCLPGKIQYYGKDNLLCMKAGETTILLSVVLTGNSAE